MAETLDDFVAGVSTQDMRRRLQTHGDLMNFLHQPASSLYCEDMEQLIDGLASWISGSNYKVSLNGLEVVSLLVDRMDEQFKPHVTTVLPVAIDRLGDSKDQVRESARDLIVKLMGPASPQFVIDRMGGAFTHKLWRVREELLICLQEALTNYGAKSISLSKLVPSIVKLLEDQNTQVRDAASKTLVEFYRHVGEKVRSDLGKKDIPQAKLTQLYAKMDEMKSLGLMLAPDAQDDVDFARPVGQAPRTGPKRVSSTSGTSTAKRPGYSTKPSTASAVSSQVTPKRKKPAILPSSGSSGAGGIDEDSFIRAFEDVPKVHIYSSRELSEKMTKIKDILSDANTAWEKRVDALKEVRAVIVAGGADYDDFYQLLRTLEPSFQLSARDLRSQVVRETCISLAYLSQTLQSRFDHFAETNVQLLINLVANSARVMASSGATCLRFIIQYTHAPRLIPIITSNLSNKASVIRRECCELLVLLLNTWPKHSLEKHIAIVQEAIKRGIGDADSGTRGHARRAYWGFADHFKSQADSLMNSLDASKQKQLMGELSNSGSASAAAVVQSQPSKSRSRSMSTERTATALYSRTMSGAKKPVGKNTANTGAATAEYTNHENLNDKGQGIARSNSAADLSGAPSSGYSRKGSLQGTSQNTNYSSLRRTGSLRVSKSAYKPRNDEEEMSEAEKRAKRVAEARLAYSQTPDSIRASKRSSSVSGLNSSVIYDTGRASTTTTGQNRNSDGTSAQRVTKERTSLPVAQSSRSKKSGVTSGQSMATPERSRSRNKMGMSQSQPSSRSGSPSSRLAYISDVRSDKVTPSTPGRPRRKSQIPRSQGASREASPTRLFSGQARERKMSGGHSAMRGNTAQRVTKGGAPVMAQRVLMPGSDVEAAVADALLTKNAQRRHESYDSDDASETSSVCSERSYSSYGRTSEDVSDILSGLSSGSWADRKEGLMGLQNLMRAGRALNRLELKKVTDVFTRMFHDPHQKVFSVFLDTLMELLAVHKLELQDWLYVCLTRLLHKMGVDMLGSVQAKVQRALDAVRENFSYDHQFTIITRFIVDQTQTPNLKVKVALMNYLHGLTQLMDPAEFTNTSDTRLAVSRIITWTTEPKSVDVRKAAQAVLIGLFNLNSSEFTMMLTVLPKTFQDGAHKILQNHLRSASQENEPLSPRNITSPNTLPTTHHRYRHQINRGEDEVENMNPEDINNSIKKMSADIQSLSKLDDGHKESSSQDSGIHTSLHDVAATRYNPTQYQQDALNGFNKAALAEAVFDDSEFFNEAPWKNLLGLNNKPDLDSEHGEVISEILSELSNHNERNDERKAAMVQLIKITREDVLEVWDEHFKTILLLLLETLGDNDGHIRALALRVLREILRNQPSRFHDYAELTILKVLEAHKDPLKEVTRSAEECAATLGQAMSADQCVRVLNPIIHTADYPVNLAAIKMQTKVIEDDVQCDLTPLLPQMMPGMLKGYDNSESSVRKASVFCLVALYLRVGEAIRPYLQHLNGSKVKLLNLYIKRAQSQRSGAGSADSMSSSKNPSPSTSTFSDIAS